MENRSDQPCSNTKIVAEENFCLDENDSRTVRLDVLSLGENNGIMIVEIMMLAGEESV